jgi:hypothetical protein
MKKSDNHKVRYIAIIPSGGRFKRGKPLARLVPDVKVTVKGRSE